VGGLRGDPVAREGAHQPAHLALLGRQVEVVARRDHGHRQATPPLKSAPLTILVTRAYDFL